MDADNPYAPPRAALDLPNAPANYTLASRWLRLFAGLIDVVFMLVLELGVMAIWFGTSADGIHQAMDYISNDDPLYVAANALGWVLVNVWLLAQGQTFGKRLLSIRVVRADGSRVSLRRMIFARTLSMTAIGLISVVGLWIVLIGLLFIFGPRRRCLHDYIADTIVVRADVVH
jgi:uncharacterized RDD family membrane protein YckC